MQAIVTMYANDEKQRAAIVASCMGKRVQVPYDSALGLDDNHVAAAFKLATALGWLRFNWSFGRLPDGSYCHVAQCPTSQYSTNPAPSVASPPENWRGRSSLSTARRT